MHPLAKLKLGFAEQFAVGLAGKQLRNPHSFLLKRRPQGLKQLPLSVA